MGKGVRVRNTTINGGMTGRDETINKVFAHKSGNTFSTMKRYAPAGNPNTLAQQAVRNIFTQTSAGWSNLTETQREVWNASAVDWKNTGIFGLKTQSGKNLFTGCNVARNSAGLPLTLEVLSKNAQVAIANSIISFTNGVLEADMEYTETSNQDRVQFAFSKQVSVGTSASQNTVIVANIIPDSNVVENLTAKYINRFGVINAGQKIFYEVRVISVGGSVTIHEKGVLTT